MSAGADELAQLFIARAGGEFLTAPAEIRQRLQSVDAFLFDWDGVFNNGAKTGDAGSPFDEADAMGTNLVRFGFWLKHGRLPYTAVITGELNPAAVHFAEREHFDAVYFKTRNKLAALEHIAGHSGVAPERAAYCFDDVLDLPVAARCALRFLVGRRASPLLARYTQERQLADYVTGRQGGFHAVREICELLLGLNEQFDEVVTRRGEFEPHYRDYLLTRNSAVTRHYTFSESTNAIQPVS